MAKNTYEGSPADMASDKKNAKKRGVSLKKWENSGADDRMDAKKMAAGGTVRGAGAAFKGKKFGKNG